MTNIAQNMQRVAEVVRKLEEQGFDVKNTIVGNAQTPVIRLFKNSKCDEMIKNGKANIQRFGHIQPIQQGFFYQDDCRICWSESLH